MDQPPPPPPPGQPPSQGPDWGDMKNKLAAARGADRLILIAGLVFFIDSFLAWYGVGPFSVSGWNSQLWAVLAILFSLAATGFAATRVLGMKLQLGNIKDGLVYLITGGGALAFVLLRFLTEMHGTKYGLYIAIIAGAVQAFGGWQKYSSSTRG